ncbi:TD and POZ domain-containing protein 3 [Trichonephila inaurata madagascariensis]|uniref:TD and POZ domain-containing protein 3 n=1 Tax=Trichonephila inaurata madagascariensis TaxID=2747483 RepID=A0A8X6XYE9_9ARAC|nr:TD and POZ domain-containing protein 3 [Trichonephila inaurata madagascariensis]
MSSSDEKLMILEFYLIEHCCEELLSICISYCTPGIKYFRFNSYLLGTNGNKIECSYQEYTNECKEGTKFVLFPAKSKLLEERQIYLPNDVLSLHCECAFSMGIAFEGIEKINRGITSTSLRNRVVESRQVDTSNALRYDLESMYNQKLFSDVKLRTKSESFEAHKGILSARSPVFRAMLTTAKEKRKECDILTDLDAGIMRRMLLYLYTDTLEDLKWESAFKLYVAADKYQILPLKDSCSTFLVSNLTKHNVCKVLVLADMNQDKDLKKIAQDYILKHDQAIFASNEWKLLLDTHTKLVAETMHLKYSNE